MSTVASAAVEAPPGAGRSELLREAGRVLRMEGAAVAALADRLGDDFVRAVELVATCEGAVVLSGIGKSGLIARKVAATLTSTGTPAVFLHPVDGLHGDLGIVAEGAVLIVVSRSGAKRGTAGAALLCPHPADAGGGDRRRHVLAPGAQRAAAALDCGVAAEACPTGPRAHRLDHRGAGNGRRPRRGAHGAARLRGRRFRAGSTRAARSAGASRFASATS